jgi:hypothetical protein
MRNLIFLSIFFASFSAFSTPLGMSKGMSLEDLKKQGDFVRGKQNFVYTAKTILSGHPDFNTYTAVLTPEHGLCSIQAVTHDIDTSGFGIELKAKFENIIQAVSEKYGEPGKIIDRLRSGSTWKEPQFWMMGLIRKDRDLVAFWSEPEYKNLPFSLSTIMIDALPRASNKGFLKIVYEFDNFDDCMKVIESKKNSNL